jgi:hypothetical protein
MRVATAGPPDDPAKRPTRWNLSSGFTSASREALRSLLNRYKKPIYHFLRLKWKMRSDETQHLVANFNAMLLGEEFLERHPPGRSSFRTYLERILQKCSFEQIKNTEGRNPGRHAASPPCDDDLPSSVCGDPESAFEWSWRMTVLERAVEATRIWFTKEKRESQFRTFQSAVLDIKGEKPPDFKELGITESNMNNHINVVRVKLREMIRAELVQTVLDKEGFDDEYRRIVGKSGTEE